MVKDMLGEVVRKIVDLSLETLKVIYDLAEKLSGEAGQEWLVQLKKFLRKENCWANVVKVKEALAWSAAWISLGLAFTGVVYFIYEKHWFGVGIPQGIPGEVTDAIQAKISKEQELERQNYVLAKAKKEAAIQAQEFEKAAQLRDQLKKLRESVFLSPL